MMNDSLLGIMSMNHGGGWDNIPHVLYRDSLTFAMNSKSRSTNTLTFGINSFHGAILDLTELMLSTTRYLLIFSMIKLPLTHAYIWYLSICCKPARNQQAGLSCAGDWSWMNEYSHTSAEGSMCFTIFELFTSDMKWNWRTLTLLPTSLVKLYLLIHRVQHVSIPHAELRLSDIHVTG